MPAKSEITPPPGLYGRILPERAQQTKHRRPGAKLPGLSRRGKHQSLFLKHGVEELRNAGKNKHLNSTCHTSESPFGRSSVLKISPILWSQSRQCTAYAILWLASKMNTWKKLGSAAAQNRTTLLRQNAEASGPQLSGRFLAWAASACKFVSHPRAWVRRSSRLR